MFGVLNLNINHLLGFLFGFILGTALHEFMHAYSALLLGDTTAQREGRVTLNPAAHFDPVGFILGVMLAFGLGFLAWGKPVPVNPYALRFGRRGMAIVAVAGPLSNLAIACVLAVIFHLSGGSLFPAVQSTIGDATPFNVHGFIFSMMSINLFLFCFNLIPIPPLDGFNILVGVLPNYWNIILEPIRRYSIPILLGMVFLLPYLGQSLARAIEGFDLNPVAEAVLPVYFLLQRLLLGTG
jgi:Zn-dependent protease